MIDEEKQKNLDKFQKEMLENIIAEANELGKKESIPLINEVITGKGCNRTKCSG